MRLSQRDYRSLLKAIFDLYEPRNLDAFQHKLPGIILKLLHCQCFEWSHNPRNRNAVVRIILRKSSNLSRRARMLLREVGDHIEQAARMAAFISALQDLKSVSGRSDQSLESTFDLSTRECQVAQWLAEGKSNPEIALILKLSRRTVEKHVEHILPKLGVENRATAAALLARISNGAAPPPQKIGASRSALAGRGAPSDTPLDPTLQRARLNQHLQRFPAAASGAGQVEEPLLQIQK